MRKKALILISFLLSTLLIANIQLLGFESKITDSDLLEEPFPFSPYTFESFEPYLTNVTFGQAGDSEISCIDIGDADNDGDNDIVLGTYPYGFVVLYENVDTGYSNEFVYRLLANYSDIHQVFPVYVNDVVIEDLEGLGNNSILIGNWYYDGGNKGDVVRFDKTLTGWEQTEVLNGLTTPIPGGVYSISVGEIGNDASRVVVVGEGGIDNLGDSNVVVYKKESSVWITEDVVITNQSRVDVCIGDYSSIYDGNEIVYCTNSVNSTLGYVAYEGGVYYNNIIANYTVRVGHSPPYTSFMNVNMGDLEGDGIEELVVAVDTTVFDADIIKIYNETNEVTIIQNMHFVSYDFEFGDFDNDGRDEFIYTNSTSVTYPVSTIHYYDWNGMTGESVFLENPFEGFASSICTGDVDNDGDIEMLYGTDGNGWLIIWDNFTLSSEIGSTVNPVVSLFYDVPFSVNYHVRYSGWNTQNINITFDLHPELVAQGPPTFIDIGDQFAPLIVSLEWSITALDYGLYNLDLTTNTTNAGNDYITDSVLVTDFEVYNTVASSTTAPIGEAVVISGQIVYAHDKSPVENAIVYLNGESVRVTDATGLFSFGITELITGTEVYNITASLEGVYDFEDCAVFELIEIEWILPVPEFSLGIIASILILVTVITQVLVVTRKNEKG